MLNMVVLTAIACLILPFPHMAEAAVKPPDYVRQAIPGAKLRGEGRLSVMVWSIYDARLWAAHSGDIFDKPFVLELTYLRQIGGRQIADTTAEEIRRQGFRDEIKIAAWHRQLKRIMPDVDADTTLAGMANKDGHTVFFKNGKEIGSIADTQFTKYFFNIWLGDKTSNPRLRQQLIGGR